MAPLYGLIVKSVRLTRTRAESLALFEPVDSKQHESNSIVPGRGIDLRGLTMVQFSGDNLFTSLEFSQDLWNIA
jgi:hypothetical protein